MPKYSGSVFNLISFGKCNFSSERALPLEIRGGFGEGFGEPGRLASEKVLNLNVEWRKPPPLFFAKALLERMRLTKWRISKEPPDAPHSTPGE